MHRIIRTSADFTSLRILQGYKVCKYHKSKKCLTSSSLLRKATKQVTHTYQRIEDLNVPLPDPCIVIVGSAQ